MAKVVLQVSKDFDIDVGGGTHYAPFGNAFFNGNTLESESQITARTAGLLTDLYVRIITNNRAASSVTLRKNGANGNLTVSIGASTTGVFQDNVNKDYISSGDLLDYIVTEGAGGTTFRLSIIQTVFDATGGTSIRWVSNSAASTTGNGTTLYTFIGGDHGFNASENFGKININVTGTWKNLHVNIGANARTTTTTFRSRKNLANGNQVVSVGAGLTGIFEDLVNTDSVSANDDLAYARIMGASAENLTTRSIATDFLTADNTFGTNNSFAGASAINFGSTIYWAVGGSPFDASITEADYQSIMGVGGKVSNLAVNISANTLNAGTSIVTLRKNGANGNNTVSIGFGTTGQFEDSSNVDFFSYSDLICHQIVTSGTAGTLSFRSIGITVLVNMPNRTLVGIGI